jgi:hypothetical protein
MPRTARGVTRISRAFVCSPGRSSDPLQPPTASGIAYRLSVSLRRTRSSFRQHGGDEECRHTLAGTPPIAHAGSGGWRNVVPEGPVLVVGDDDRGTRSVGPVSTALIRSTRC